ncbi:helix-turn-helix transcriptional regulator [Agromyces lapidis]|uniref:Helix-turn-helix transcriptional regulator n=1 Tax=Agromyces lapidis TaxID=279574 RepID=A0ABV5SRU6_9MICO|nr:helix-turn-helix domain-containing protein [Agromyces lapidis]
MAGTTEPDPYRTLSSYSRVALLHLLQQQPAQTVVELAAAVGLHHNTTREHLQRLVDDGFVTATPEHRPSRGRPRLRYSAATGSVEERNPPAQERLRHAVERGDLLRRAVPNTADRADAGFDRDARRQIDALDDHLDRTGFEPEIDTEQLRVQLAGCPFQSMVDEHRDVVCSVHFGVIRTVLAHAGGPIEARELLPFSAPGCCTLQLAVDEG